MPVGLAARSFPIAPSVPAGQSSETTSATMLSDRALAAMPLLTSAIAVLIIVGLLALAGCGEEAKPVEDLAPEEVQAKLLDREFVTGEIITDGANVGVAKGGKLDAEAYLGVDETPRVSGSTSASTSSRRPRRRPRSREGARGAEDRGFHAEVVGDMEVEVAGDTGDLQRVIARD